MPGTIYALTPAERFSVLEQMDALSEADIEAWYEIAVRIYGRSAGECQERIEQDVHETFTRECADARLVEMARALQQRSK